MEEMVTKVCARCGLVKPATTKFFHKKLDRLIPQCKECRSVFRREQYGEKKDDWNQKRREARAANPEHFRALDKERYLRNPEKHQVQSARSRQKRDPEELKAWGREYYKKNKETRIAQAVAWAKANPERRKEIMRKVNKRQRQDSGFRLKAAVAAYIYLCLKEKKAGRKWETLVGYTLSQLMRHIERQFTQGMSWDNYGEWQVDHIIAASSFKYATAEDSEFKACWALTNLRPLWAPDNIRKGDKRIFLI